MKIRYAGPFPVEVPALGRQVEPGGAVDVKDAAVADSLLRQGWEPADKAAEAAQKKITNPEPVQAPEPQEA